MNITIFNKTYVMRRYEDDGSYTDTEISIHLHPQENGSGAPWPETQGIVRHISGHGMVGLREADLERGTKGDRVNYMGRWYECVSSVLYDHTVLSHYNYQFIVVPEDVIDTITIFNPVLDEDVGYDVYHPTVIRGVSWISNNTASVENTGIKSASKYTIRIPEDADFSGKTYVSPSAYEGSENTFTFRPGDIIVRGEENESSAPSALREKYGEIVTVLGVSDFRRAPNARHWKIEGE